MFWLATLLRRIRAGHCSSPHLQHASPYGRGLRASVAERVEFAFRNRDPGTGRQRRGCLMVIPSAWRRCVLGTNHISSFGIWRQGARRMAKRANSAGETRWHRPYRSRAADCKAEAL